MLLYGVVRAYKTNNHQHIHYEKCVQTQWNKENVWPTVLIDELIIYIVLRQMAYNIIWKGKLEMELNLLNHWSRDKKTYHQQFLVVSATFHMDIKSTPDNKVHGANMWPTWVLSAPDRPHVGPINLAVRVSMVSFRSV